MGRVYIFQRRLTVALRTVLAKLGLITNPCGGPMFRAKRSQGFSLIELLLVLAILGIISGIAIPAYLAQRRRARIIGDALSNAKTISMFMEQFKADNGNYGPLAATATWLWGPNYNTPTLTGFTTNPCPNFRPAGNSLMNFTLTVGNTLNPTTGTVTPGGGSTLTYVIEVVDSTDATNTVIVRTNESAATWRMRGY